MGERKRNERPLASKFGGGVPLRVHLVLICVQVAFGSFHVLGKGILEHLHPLALAGIRVGCAAPILLLLAWRVERSIPQRRDIPLLALLGFFGIFANQILFIFGLGMTTATNAGILMPSIPVFAAGVAAMLGVESINRRKGAGIALAVVGALVMLNITSFSVDGRRGLGNILILLNCLSFSFFLVLQKPLLNRLGPLTLIAWAYLFGGGGVVLASLGKIAACEPAQIPSWVWWGMLYVILVPTVISYSANTWAVRHSSPTLAATYITLQPLSSAGLAAIFLGETIGLREVLGFLLIVAGLTLVSRSGKTGLSVDLEKRLE